MALCEGHRQKANTLKIFCKTTFRLWVLSIYETQRHSRFRFVGLISQDILVCVRIWKKLKGLLIPNPLNDRPDLAGFWRAVPVSYCFSDFRVMAQDSAQQGHSMPSVLLPLSWLLSSFHSRSAVTSVVNKLPSTTLSPLVLLIHCFTTAKWSKSGCRV